MTQVEESYPLLSKLHTSWTRILFTLMDECALFSDLMKVAYRIFVVADPVFKRRMDKLRITTPGVVRVMLSPE